jgi:hypothetical protein
MPCGEEGPIVVLSVVVVVAAAAVVVTMNWYALRQQ